MKRRSIDIQCDDFLYNVDILCLTETQIGFAQPYEDIMQTVNEQLPDYKINYNNDQHQI